MMRKILLTHCIVFLMLTGFLPGQVYHSCPVYSSGDYKNPLYDQWLSAYDVKFYHINLEVDNRSTEINGHVTILAEAVKSFDTLVLELQDDLDLFDIIIDSSYHPEVLRFNDAIYIPLSEPKSIKELISVTIYYGGKAGQDRGFFAGITSSTDSKYNADVTYTLSEPHNAKDWFPVKQVLEDKIDSAWIYITCRKDLMAGSNGILEEVESISSNRHTFK